MKPDAPVTRTRLPFVIATILFDKQSLISLLVGVRGEFPV